MKFRVLFAACATAAAVVSSAAAAAAAPSGAASGGTARVGPVASAPAAQVVNLSAASARAVQDTAGTIAGVVPPRTARLRIPHTKPTISCTEPVCNMAYNGGRVQHSPHVYLLLWGPKWSHEQTAANYLYNLYRGLGVPGRDGWSGTTVQYGDGRGRPGFTGAVLVGKYLDPSTPQRSVTPNNLATEAGKLATRLHIKDVIDAQVVVAAQSGTCFSDGFAGSCGKPITSGPGYCGWHSITSSGVPFTNLPYQLDAGLDCGENWINPGTNGRYDGFTTVGGHEYAETITDPNPPFGWADLSDNVSGGEIGDKCAWGGQIFGLSDPAGDVKLSTGTFAMQSLWSNAGSHCVMRTVPRLTVAKPANQTSKHGKAVSLQIHASSNPSTALVYTAAGLPRGLTINRLTGRITGKPAKAGTFKPSVTVADVASSARVTFTWKVT